eukprot:362200-Chlamydomonas_euryale.AAC.13
MARGVLPEGRPTMRGRGHDQGLRRCLSRCRDCRVRGGERRKGSPVGRTTDSGTPEARGGGQMNNVVGAADGLQRRQHGWTAARRIARRTTSGTKCERGYNVAHACPRRRVIHRPTRRMPGADG